MTYKIKRIFLILSILSLYIISKNNVIALENNRNIIYNDININYNDTLDIKVKNVDLKNKKVKLDKNYEGMAIITLEVKNKDVVDVELSNIDVYPYQNHKSTECFVITQQGEVTGMIGNLQRGDKKDIKIGVALENLKSPLRLEFKNIDEFQQYQVTQNINLK
ncbi:hypothetical protein [Paeniclostridium hominis]|uniref:hypothetical protein n=1 Tax=Paeniclostridium hominis TaxID=2764329 RepID=UPI0022E31F55|nr:hypothetical protein [Paeniclostridium hominis]